MAATRPDPWPWAASLDGPVAAGDNHHVLFENDRVRVLDVVIEPGETTPVHTHEAPTVSYVLSGSGFVRRDEHGAVMVDTSTADPPFVMPRVLWSDFTPSHSLENPGPDSLHVIAVELKDPA
jgi:predicted metal-dependent enzyme (double-stranded beta helix superfamily)